MGNVKKSQYKHVHQYQHPILNSFSFFFQINMAQKELFITWNLISVTDILRMYDSVALCKSMLFFSKNLKLISLCLQKICSLSYFSLHFWSPCCKILTDFRNVLKFMPSLPYSVGGTPKMFKLSHYREQVNGNLIDWDEGYLYLNRHLKEVSQFCPIYRLIDSLTDKKHWYQTMEVINNYHYY